MRILIKSRNYLMKCLVFVLLFGFISLGAIGGCNNNGGDGSSQDTQALTERDFFNNPGLSANPEDGVVVVFLEPTGAPEVDNLTGGLGFDIIPYRYTRTLNHTFCWEDDNVDSNHFMILRNSGGEEVLRVEANGGCVTERIEAGDYEMVLTHGEHDDGIDPIFLIPAPEEEQVTKRYEFDQKEFRTANGFSYKMHRYIPGGIVKFFESISNVFTRPAIAQTGTGTPSVNIITLVIIRSCVMCDLSGVSLGGLSLSGANLTGADLNNANLIGADLNNADLNNANLSNAFVWCANLTGANLIGANLFHVVMVSATWCDGCICSIVECPPAWGCQGCLATVDEVCTGS